MKKLITMCAVLCVVSVVNADIMWGTASPDFVFGTGGASPVVFQLDTSTGTVSNTISFGAGNGNFMWISGFADSGQYLYASHNIYDTAKSSNTHDFRIAKIDRTTGAILSDTSISGFLGQTYSQVNALNFVNGKLYGVENATSGSTIRGYALEIGLDSNGDVNGAAKGAYVGPNPDGALAYKDGTWYASDWRKDYSSYIMTTTDIMNTNFTTSTSTSPVGLISGWDFEADGDFIGVSWWASTSNPYDDFNVYKINPTTGVETTLFNIQSQLPSDVTWLSGLSVVPEPATMSLLGLGALTLLRKKRKA